MKRFFIAALFLALVNATHAGTNGGLAGAFGRIGAGARAKAMGNAYTGLAAGPSAIYFNPGALPFQGRPQFAATTSRMALDRRYDYLAFVSSVRPKAGPDKRAVNAGVGVGWLHAGVGDIDSRDFDGNPMEMIDQSSNLFLFGFGIQFHEQFGAGLAAKVIYETFGKIGNEERSINGDGFGVDLGAFARPIEHLTVGATVKEIGSQTTWNTTEYWSQGSTKTDKWPLVYRVGGAWEQSGITGVLDLESSEKAETKIHAGVEGALDITDRQSVAGRVGFDDGAVTLGLGVGFAVLRFRSQLDFTYVIEDVAPDDAVIATWGVEF